MLTCIYTIDKGPLEELIDPESVGAVQYHDDWHNYRNVLQICTCKCSSMSRNSAEPLCMSCHWLSLPACQPGSSRQTVIRHYKDYSHSTIRGESCTGHVPYMFCGCCCVSVVHAWRLQNVSSWAVHTATYFGLPD